MANNQIIDAARVRGWAVDADPQNDPTYPSRDRAADDHKGQWERPALQQSEVEILQSIEHVRTPAVFGTATPPSGLSGMVRRSAFRWSESNWLHWLLLMGADRINVVEGIAQDFGRGKVPNIPAEMGIRAGWEHDRKRVATKAAVVVGVSAALVLLVSRRRARKRSDAAGTRAGKPLPG